MPFDKDSGLVFKEETVRVPGCQHDVEHKSLYVKQRQHNRPEHGTSSLSKTAINTLLNNLSNLDVEALRPLPKHVVVNLWKAITRAGADSLHAWQVFANTGHFGRNFTKTFRISCIQCSRRLLGLAGEVTLHCQPSWLTTITICDPAYDIAQFMDLAKLDGLQNLYIQSNSASSRPQGPKFSDRFLRALAAEARDYGALPRLQTLFIDSQRDVTLSSLRYLNDFPALSLFCARDCNLPKLKTLQFHMPGTGWHLDRGQEVAGSFYHYMTLQHSHEPSLPWPSSVHSFLQHRRRQQFENDRPMLDIEVVPYGQINSFRSTVPLTFNAFAARVRCFLRDKKRASGAKAMPAPEPSPKRRKLNAKKSGAFDDLLHG